MKVKKKVWKTMENPKSHADWMDSKRRRRKRSKSSEEIKDKQGLADKDADVIYSTTISWR